MSIVGFDIVALATGGVLKVADTGVAPTAPSTPTLSVTLSGTTATAAITGDAGVTNYLLYKNPGDTAWTAGGSRVGDGDIEISDLDRGAVYIFTVYSSNSDVLSIPASETVYIPVEQTETTLISDQAAESMVQLIAQRGVDVIYRPAAGVARTIKAIIRQKPPSQLGSATKASSTFTTALVLNDSTTGISSAELDRGGDKIDIETRIGKDAAARPIKGIIFHNAAVMKLEIR